MKKFQLGMDLWVPADIEKVWTLAKDPKNLAAISPPHIEVEVPQEAKTELGCKFTLKMGLKGTPLSINWSVQIKDICNTGSKRFFVDEQTEGPFAFWRHEHHFYEGVKEIQGQRTGKKLDIKTPGTWLVDRVEYAMKWGFCGEVAEKLFARKELELMFAYRRQKIWEMFQE